MLIVTVTTGSVYIEDRLRLVYRERFIYCRAFATCARSQLRNGIEPYGTRPNPPSFSLWRSWGRRKVWLAYSTVHEASKAELVAQQRFGFHS
jgi:hypothetical protein